MDAAWGINGMLLVASLIPEACLSYDAEEARLVLVNGDERHEIQIRAQAHRLVRYMVERNEVAGGAPVLCTHDELMQAVWADEPMHSREELAKLVWELRKKLEPFGAEQLIENERGRGYRMRTCPPSAERGAPQATGLQRRGLALMGGLVVVAAVAAAAALLATRGSSTKPSAAKLGAFVDRIENVLVQSAQGRQEIAAALAGGRHCTIPPRVAGRRIQSVGDNRQSILQQLGSLSAPTQEADNVVTLLQQALQNSIEADRHYRDGFFSVGPKARCPLPRNEGFTLAAKSDARATLAKGHLVAAFDPLAARFHRRTWSAGGF
jgi:DNA-binding winged helix-turn-helix (wHTH) protein